MFTYKNNTDCIGYVYIYIIILPCKYNFKIIALLKKRPRENFLFSLFEKDATPSHPRYIIALFPKKEIHSFSLVSNVNTNIKLLQTIGYRYARSGKKTNCYGT